VKRLLLVAGVVMLAGVCLIPAFAVDENEYPTFGPRGVKRHVTRPGRAQRAQETARGAETNVPTPADVNAIEAKVKKFKGLKEELEALDKTRGDENRQWALGALEEKLSLARGMQRQIEAELKLLRKCAVEEKAEKTTAAIDYLMMKRNAQFAGLIKKMEIKKRFMLRQEREQRRGLRRGRNIRGRQIEEESGRGKSSEERRRGRSSGRRGTESQEYNNRD